MSAADGELDEDAVWGAGSEGAASDPELEEERRGAGHDDGEVSGSGGRGGVDGGVGVVVVGGSGVDSGAPLSVGALGRLPLSDLGAPALAPRGGGAGGPGPLRGGGLPGRGGRGP